jgi:hypothetical protein
MRRHAVLDGANTPKLLINVKKRPLTRGLDSAKRIWRTAE